MASKGSKAASGAASGAAAGAAAGPWGALIGGVVGGAAGYLSGDDPTAPPPQAINPALTPGAVSGPGGGMTVDPVTGQVRYTNNNVNAGITADEIQRAKLMQALGIGGDPMLQLNSQIAEQKALIESLKKKGSGSTAAAEIPAEYRGIQPYVDKEKGGLWSGIADPAGIKSGKYGDQGKQVMEDFAKFGSAYGGDFDRWLRDHVKNNDITGKVAAFEKTQAGQRGNAETTDEGIQAAQLRLDNLMKIQETSNASGGVTGNPLLDALNKQNPTNPNVGTTQALFDKYMKGAGETVDSSGLKIAGATDPGMPDVAGTNAKLQAGYDANNGKFGGDRVAGPADYTGSKLFGGTEVAGPGAYGGSTQFGGVAANLAPTVKGPGAYGGSTLFGGLAANIDPTAKGPAAYEGSTDFGGGQIGGVDPYTGDRRFGGQASNLSSTSEAFMNRNDLGGSTVRGPLDYDNSKISDFINSLNRTAQNSSVSQQQLAEQLAARRGVMGGSDIAKLAAQQGLDDQLAANAARGYQLDEQGRNNYNTQRMAADSFNSAVNARNAQGQQAAASDTFAQRMASGNQASDVISRQAQGEASMYQQGVNNQLTIAQANQAARARQAAGEASMYQQGVSNDQNVQNALWAQLMGRATQNSDVAARQAAGEAGMYQQGVGNDAAYQNALWQQLMGNATQLSDVTARQAAGEAGMYQQGVGNNLAANTFNSGVAARQAQGEASMYQQGIGNQFNADTFNSGVTKANAQGSMSALQSMLQQATGNEFAAKNLFNQLQQQVFANNQGQQAQQFGMANTMLNQNNALLANQQGQDQQNFTNRLNLQSQLLGQGQQNFNQGQQQQQTQLGYNNLGYQAANQAAGNANSVSAANTASQNAFNMANWQQQINDKAAQQQAFGQAAAGFGSAYGSGAWNTQPQTPTTLDLRTQTPSQMPTGNPAPSTGSFPAMGAQPSSSPLFGATTTQPYTPPNPYAAMPNVASWPPR